MYACVCLLHQNYLDGQMFDQIYYEFADIVNIFYLGKFI